MGNKMFLIHLFLGIISFILLILSLFIINSFIQIKEIIKDINYKNFNTSLKDDKEISKELNKINKKLNDLNHCLDSLILQLNKLNK